jgi:hypothetical protein
MAYPRKVPRLIGKSTKLFRDGVRTEESWAQYERRFIRFLQWVGCKNNADDFLQKTRADPKWAEDKIIEYIRIQKERVTQRKISYRSVGNFLKPVKLFLEMNLEPNEPRPTWTKISRILPPKGRYARDRTPTREEIRKIVASDDMRVKVIGLTMASSGIRVGAWNYLKREDLSPIQRDGRIVACEVIVYAATPDEYISFITPEAYIAINDYFQYRERYGEQLTSQSPILRNKFNISKPVEKLQTEAERPRQLKHSAVKRLIERVLWDSGLRVEKKRRHEFAVDHGFRKFFKAQCEQVMKPINVETLIGHSTGISDSYYRPTENELLEDYLKAVPLLTISEVAEVHQKSEQEKKQLEARLDRLEASVAHLIRRKEEQLLSLADIRRRDMSQ